MTTQPSIIVIAEDGVHSLLANSGVHWNVQHPVADVAQMWDDLSGGRLDAESVGLIFSDSTLASPQDIGAAIAAMAPHGQTFIIQWDTDRTQAVMTAAHAIYAEQGIDPAQHPTYGLDPNDKHTFLETLRAVFTNNGTVAFPATYACDTTGPIEITTEEVVFEPESHDNIGSHAHLDPATPSPETTGGQFDTPATQQTYAATGEPDYQSAAQAHATDTAFQPGIERPTSPEQLRDLSDQIIENQVTVAVTSSKGGSGKSTSAMMLAAAIAQSSKKAFEEGKMDRPLKVCLVDMDTRDGQVASLLGEYMPTALNIRASPTWDKETVLRNLVRNENLGIDALLAPIRPRTAQDVGPDFYRHVIRVLKTTHDVVIMDTSVNYLEPLISTVCLPEATQILFVTTLATTSVQGMARALREITEPVKNGGMGVKRSKIGVVMNQTVTQIGMDKDQIMTAALKVGIAGSIPMATKDVLICTNYCRMHLLLGHELLGPAYFNLAKAVMKGVPLSPLTPVNAGTPQGRPVEPGQPVGQALTQAASTPGMQPGAVPPVIDSAAVPVGAGAPVEGGDRKRGVFRGRG